MPRRPSTRRNCDYSHHITWAYELNKALNNYSKEADRTTYGYGGRLKKIWDEHHLEHTNLTANHLATQAKRIEEKGLLMETRLKKTKAANTQNVTPKNKVKYLQILMKNNKRILQKN